MPDYTPEQKAAAFDALWETCGLGQGVLRDWVDRPVSRAARETTFLRVPRYAFEILAEGEGMQRFRDVLHHLATRKVDCLGRRVVDGDMPPEGLNVLFWIRGSWRCGSWIRRDDGICWVVEESSWVEPGPWSERMQRPTHWMPQPEAPNEKDNRALPSGGPMTEEGTKGWTR